MASFARLINTAPIPIFGAARTAAAFVVPKAKTLPRFAGWLGPLGAGALWFVWPAVDDGWKIEMGLKADPEAAAKKASAAAPKVELSAEAAAKVEGAYKEEAHVQTEDDKMLTKASATGDFSYFEEKWEAFNEKAIKPGEDDDDDDDDDDEDDDEEEDEDDDDDE